MSRRDRMHKLGLLDGPEQHALVHDGLVDITHIAGGASGYSNEYALVLKMASLPTTNAGWPVPGHLSNSSASPFANNVTDAVQCKNASPPCYRHLGLTTAGAVSFDRETGATGQAAGGQLHMSARDLVANLVRVRVVVASDQSLFWAPADAATSQDSSPDDICIGGYLNPNRTLNSGPCDIALVAVCMFWSIPADDLLQKYARKKSRDARVIFGSALKGYWVPSLMTPANTIAPLVGTATATCNGPTRSDLVRLAA